VDLIFVSPALRPQVREGRAQIFDGAGVREASDHRPVYVVLDLAP
jgi:exonuclease III